MFIRRGVSVGEVFPYAVVYETRDAADVLLFAAFTFYLIDGISS